MRITILNQFFPPDLSPTAHLAASLARHRAGLGDEVTVVAGRSGYVDAVEGGLPAPSAPSGVRVIRLPTPGSGRSSVVTRVAGYLGFTVGAWLRLLTLPRQDVVVSLTTPPYIFVAAMAHKLLHPRCRVVLWSMDVYPDAAERFGQLDPGGVPSRALRGLNRRLYPRLDHLVCLDGAMRELLAGQYGRGTVPPTSVIPNWEPATLFDGDAEERGAGAPQPDPELGERFVVLYTGNAGTGHRFDTVLAAAGRLDTSSVAFCFVGGGSRWGELEAARSALDSGPSAPLVLRGYVEKSEIPALLRRAGAALITLDDRALGVMSPSKLHSYLGAGCPVVYVGPEGSNVDEAIRRFECGISLRHGDVEGLVQAVEVLAGDASLRRRLGRRARQAFEQAYSDRTALPLFDAVIDP